MSPQVNGEVPNAANHSAFIQHLLDYPLISDGIHTFKSNELGQRSLAIGDSAYKTFAAPVVPYFAKPYEYVSPYVTRADSFGDKTLDRIDEKFPVVKKPTGELVDSTKSIVFFPLKKGNEGKDYVFGVYNGEVKKLGGEGVVTYGKAAVAAGLIVGSDAISWLSSFLAQKKEQAKEVSNEKTGN